ncbi:unnamed protein product [Fraxinus pennsylvanica]|uniref:RNase H type-1 domain-containing protein n=1 Tax=Fraxinus pennsylvanica TaxID=56036 RepID=A0AAD1ZI93_9LAMI|nr:unnamed protein product [Fraxinus pennsylvanica]
MVQTTVLLNSSFSEIVGGPPRRKRLRQFKFEPLWLCEKGCIDVIHEGWSPGRNSHVDSDGIEGRPESARMGGEMDRINGRDCIDNFVGKIETCRDKLVQWGGNIRELPAKIKTIRSKLKRLKEENFSVTNFEKIRSLEGELELLLNKEELYWKQRSRMDWLHHGDRNSKFFHSKASARKVNNTMLGLFDVNGTWRTDCEGIGDVVANYFHTLFQSSQPSPEDIETVTQAVNPVVSDHMNRVLRDPFTDKEAISFKSMSQAVPQIHTVSELITYRGWNHGLLEECFNPVDSEAIRSIPLGKLPTPDQLIWRHSEDGEYCVKSGYWLAYTIKTPGLEVSSSYNSYAKWWKFLWALNIRPKVRAFMYRAFNNIIPALFNLTRRHVPISPVCDMCHLDYETAVHALIRCDRAYAMWYQAGLGKLISEFKGTEFSNFTMLAYHKLKINEFEKLCMTAWQIWSDQNVLHHGRSVPPVQHQCEKVEVFLADFQSTQLSLKVSCRVSANQSGISRRKFWKAPPTDELILNTDAAVNIEEGEIAIGAVVRNHRGEVMVSLGKVFKGNYSPLTAKILAIREGLEFVADSGLRVNIVETDSLLSVQAISLHPPFSQVLNVAEDCSFLMARMENCKIRHAPRQTNQVAHELALLAKNSRIDFMCCEEVPEPIVNLVNYDISHMID